ncbi:zf-HC2 domain-containing protein [Streptomyces sp. DH8]|uniref:zf-HC2 domain-containing protein n=1 Tax=Streptomyces sp. DH8 TaxID=2857008 RepID=UPI001E2F033F|nr:zf-HC2 domain-containing protein [Streptomyces sp. DH8]
MSGDGRAGEGDEEGVRGARRIPGPRGAADDLDLGSVPLPPLPPPGAVAPGEAVPEQSAPDPAGPEGRDAAARDVSDAPAPDARDASDRNAPEAGAPAPSGPEEPEERGPEGAEVAGPDEPVPCGPDDPGPDDLGPDAPDEAAPSAPDAPDDPAPSAPAGAGPVAGAAAPGTPPEPFMNAGPVLPHRVLQSLLGAWALSVCSAEETAAVEDHLTGCGPCADEAVRLREAVGLLHPDGSLDVDPTLRSRVVDGCLSRRPARIPIPGWAAPYDAETARLDALLRDIGDADWHAPVRLRWFERGREADRRTTVAGVIGHLTAVDGLLSAALGLDDPLGGDAPLDPALRTEAYWSGAGRPLTRAVRGAWRAQSHELIRTASFHARDVAGTSVPYGAFALPLRDAAVERAFECWVHGGDIADAVDYPYPAPSAAHLHLMIEVAVHMLPAALAARRTGGARGPAAGKPGRSLHLEIEGHGGGDWYIALDSAGAAGSPERAVAQVALDGVEFCRLVAGRISPVDAAAGQEGDREAIRDVLFAAASLSRL